MVCLFLWRKSILGPLSRLRGFCTAVLCKPVEQYCFLKNVEQEACTITLTRDRILNLSIENQ